MNKFSKFIFLLMSLFILSFSFGQICFAKTVPANRLKIVADQTGIPQEQNLQGIAANVIKMILASVGTIFLILTVYAGFLWMTANGEEERVTKSKNTLITSTIGLLIIISSYAITNLVMDRLINGIEGVPNVDINFSEEPEDMGCCIDWVQSENAAADRGFLDYDIGPIENRPIPTARITTEADCELQGTNNGRGDFHSGPKGNGNWEFFPEFKDMVQCNRKMLERDALFNK